MYEIILYDTEDGRCPVQELLDSLEPKLLAKTLRTIDLLEMNGPLLREPYSKPLENGIFELRAKQGSDITRVLYFFIIGKKAVLTNGFIKKSQKTPKAEKELAKKYKADYERRYGSGSLCLGLFPCQRSGPLCFFGLAITGFARIVVASAFGASPVICHCCHLLSSVVRCRFPSR